MSLPDWSFLILERALRQNSYRTAAASGVFTECAMMAISASKALTAMDADSLAWFL